MPDTQNLSNTSAQAKEALAQFCLCPTWILSAFPIITTKYRGERGKIFINIFYYSFISSSIILLNYCLISHRARTKGTKAPGLKEHNLGRICKSKAMIRKEVPKSHIKGTRGAMGAGSLVRKDRQVLKRQKLRQSVSKWHY